MLRLGHARMPDFAFKLNMGRFLMQELTACCATSPLNHGCALRKYLAINSHDLHMQVKGVTTLGMNHTA